MNPRLKVGVGICGSFCNFELVIAELKKLVEKYEIIIFVTDEVKKFDNRFGTYSQFVEEIHSLGIENIVDNSSDAELYGRFFKLDFLIIMPLTATSCSKLSNSIFDNAVLMVAKGMKRNDFPIIVAIASNDFLGISSVHLAKLFTQKSIFFVPFRQDDYINKPTSLVAQFELLQDTIECALQNKQIQPILLKGEC